MLRTMYYIYDRENKEGLPGLFDDRDNAEHQAALLEDYERPMCFTYTSRPWIRFAVYVAIEDDNGVIQDLHIGCLR